VYLTRQRQRQRQSKVDEENGKNKQDQVLAQEIIQTKEKGI